MTPAADTHDFTELLSGFAEPAAAPAIQRRWVTVVTGGGHVSGVFWHTGTPGTVLLHDSALSARSFDAVLRAYGRPAVAVDLPGHGRSAWRKSGDYRPRRLAKALEETVLSYAAIGPVVAGRGLGALAGLALAARFPAAVGRLVLIDTLPGPVARGPEERWPWPSPAFGSRAAAAAWLQSTNPGLSEDEAAQHAVLETVQTADGRWVWRHHLAELDGSRPDDFNDDTLWTQLAAVRAPVLVRAEHGGLDDALVDRFRAESQHGEVIDLPGAGHRVEHDRPDALAEVLGRIADRR
jgi:pimeloyl-ACP methyl ester carboxylesterase